MQSSGKECDGGLSIHKKTAQPTTDFRHRSKLFLSSWKSHKQNNGRNTDVTVVARTGSYLAKHTTTPWAIERNQGLQPPSWGCSALLPIP